MTQQPEVSIDEVVTNFRLERGGAEVQVPPDYVHLGYLNTFVNRYQTQFSGFSHLMNDGCFPGASHPLAPGQRYWVQLVRCMAAPKLKYKADQALDFLRATGGMLVGARGLALMWELEMSGKLTANNFFEMGTGVMSLDVPAMLHQPSPGDYKIPLIKCFDDLGSRVYSMLMAPYAIQWNPAYRFLHFQQIS